MNVDCMKKVADNVPLKIAAGERLYTRYMFREYIESQVARHAPAGRGPGRGDHRGKKDRRRTPRRTTCTCSRTTATGRSPQQPPCSSTPV